MILRPFIILCYGLSLCACDKPGMANKAEDGSSSTASRERRVHAPREASHGSPGALSSELNEAIEIENPSERAKAIADVAWNAMEMHPEIAHEAFLKLPADSPEKIRLIQHYAMTLAASDVSEALEWASALNSETEIAAAKAQIALALAETDPHRAANLLSESGIAGRELDVAVVQVIQRWAAKSAPEAAAWVSAFPPGEARMAGITEISGKWLPRDPSAAFQWLGGLKDPDFKGEAARAIEGVILQQSAETQKAWLEHADPGIRAELEKQRDQAILDVGDNIPTPEK